MNTKEDDAVHEDRDSIVTRFARVVAAHADGIAISTDSVQWTYAELDWRSTAIAHLIAQRNPAGRVLALLMNHGAPLVAAILGVLKAGKIYLALDPADPSATHRALLSEAEATLLIADEANASLAKVLTEKSSVLELGPLSTEASSSTTLPNVTSEAGAWLMFTSGSSGRPKGVWQNHAGVVHQADVYSRLVGIAANDRLSLLTSCNLAASATALFGALLNGATLCPFHLRSRGIDRLASWIIEQKISIYHSVPTVFRHLIRAAGERNVFESVRWIRLGGEPVLRSDVDLFQKSTLRHTRLLHAYSSTETGLVAATVIDHETQMEGRVPVGKPMPEASVTLLGAEDGSAQPDDIGKIVVSGPGIARGYWRQENGQAGFQLMDGRHSFVTNDLGRFLPDGTLEHLGRSDSVVKIRGRRIDIAEVEAALRSLDSVNEAAVAAFANAEGEQRLIAFVIFKSGEVETSRLREELRTRLPDAMMPSEFVAVSELPQTSGGKLDRKALREPKSPRIETGRRLMPRDGIERKVARIWESVLGIEGIGRREDFFELGGTSIHSPQVISRIEQAFNVALPLSVLSEHGTIVQLAQRLARETIASAASPLVALRSGGAGLPLFLIHNGKGDISTYGQLARRLEGRSIYALQSPGLDGCAWPFSDIREMANAYIAEILRVHPDGPILLGGTCMGGMVAFEIATQLAALGKPVAMLALIDSRLPDRSILNVVRNEARDLFRIPRWFLTRQLFGRIGPTLLPGYRRFVANMNSRALRRFQPTFYSGNVTIVTTADTPQRSGDRRLTIRHFAREVELITIPGIRSELFMAPAVDDLARALQACIEKVEVVSAVCAA